MAKLTINQLLQQGVEAHKAGQVQEALRLYTTILKALPKHPDANHNTGLITVGFGKIELALPFFRTALEANPSNAQFWYSHIVALIKLERLMDATVLLDQARSKGFTGSDFDKLEQKLNDANNTLDIKPDDATVYYNMGIAFKDQGKLEEAIEAYNKALAIKPDYAEAHRHLSVVKKYNPDTAQISEVEVLLQRTDLNASDRCHLLYTYAKMQEDLGNLNDAFDSYVAGGDLRQDLMGYEFIQYEHLFDQIKKTAPRLKNSSISLSDITIRHTPIFILGMPRSGTTLVEQVVSSHTQVTGAGELDYIYKFGIDLAIGLKPPDIETMHVFRQRYLAELAKKAKGQALITDKLPGNFVFTALICAAFPEAKIVNVNRNAEAVCWSNFKHYFSSKGHGYSYNLTDTVKYYRLYMDLMDIWYQKYGDRIYNLDYDKLTEDQEPEIRRLIEYLELSWQDACLAPEKNKRAVKTASQHQVRMKIYKGSSQAWRKYEPFLDRVFDGLKS